MQPIHGRGSFSLSVPLCAGTDNPVSVPVLHVPLTQPPTDTKPPTHPLTKHMQLRSTSPPHARPIMLAPAAGTFSTVRFGTCRYRFHAHVQGMKSVEFLHRHSSRLPQAQIKFWHRFGMKFREQLCFSCSHRTAVLFVFLTSNEEREASSI